MPDQISNYTQVRLVMQLPHKGPRVSWSLNVTTTRNGIPSARSIADGHVEIGGQLGTPEAIHEAVALVSRELLGRFPLIDTP